MRRRLARWLRAGANRLDPPSPKSMFPAVPPPPGADWKTTLMFQRSGPAGLLATKIAEHLPDNVVGVDCLLHFDDGMQIAVEIGHDKHMRHG
jgi:hypothetical protein